MTINLDFLKFHGIKRKSFTIDDLIAFVDDTDTKRLCFAMDGQKDPLKDGRDGVIKWLNLPFRDTIAAIIDKEAEITVLNRKIGMRCCYPCRTQDEINRIQKFIDTYRDFVFLRDYLDLSICLSMRELDIEHENRTPIGELEYLVKYCNDGNRQKEMTQLKDALQAALDKLPFFKEVDYICAIPSSRTFVNEIIQQLDGFAFENISDKVFWSDKQTDIKNATDGKVKLELLDKSKLTFAKELTLNGKNVLLIDDLYSSGLTMQYVALRMKEAGASRVFGISFVKALKNS